MAALFLLNGQTPAIAAGTRLLKAPEAEAFLGLKRLAERMRAEEIEARERAERAFEESRQRGYREGLEAGRDEYAMKMMDTVMASVEYLEKLEGDLAGIVEEAVRKIIGQTPPDQVAAGLVRKALAMMRDDRRVVVRVSPEDERAVRGALEGPEGAVSSLLDVKADGRLARGACVLESDLGVVEASVETQLKNLSAALRSRVNAGG
jgi:type III secretion protein L